MDGLLLFFLLLGHEIEGHIREGWEGKWKKSKERCKLEGH